MLNRYCNEADFCKKEPSMAKAYMEKYRYEVKDFVVSLTDCDEITKLGIESMFRNSVYNNDEEIETDEVIIETFSKNIKSIENDIFELTRDPELSFFTDSMQGFNELKKEIDNYIALISKKRSSGSFFQRLSKKIEAFKKGTSSSNSSSKSSPASHEDKSDSHKVKKKDEHFYTIRMPKNSVPTDIHKLKLTK